MIFCCGNSGSRRRGTCLYSIDHSSLATIPTSHTHATASNSRPKITYHCMRGGGIIISLKSQSLVGSSHLDGIAHALFRSRIAVIVPDCTPARRRTSGACHRACSSRDNPIATRGTESIDRRRIAPYHNRPSSAQFQSILEGTCGRIWEDLRSGCISWHRQIGGGWRRRRVCRGELV